jgi:hypothetical protein
MNLPKPPENEPRDISQKIWGYELDSSNEPTDRANDQPPRRAQEVATDGTIGMVIPAVQDQYLTELLTLVTVSSDDMPTNSPRLRSSACGSLRRMPS